MDGEVELPCKTEIMEVWCDGGNGEDSGVEVVRAASCGSSVLSGYSEPDGTSECGSDTYTHSTVKVLAAQLTQQLDLAETCSESSSTTEGRTVTVRPSRLSKKPSAVGEAKGRESRGRATPRADGKPKVPAKPANLKTTPRTRQSESGHQKSSSDTDGRWPFSAQKAAKPRATSAADPARKSGPASLVVTSQHIMTSSFGSAALYKSMTSSFGRTSPTTEGRSSALDMYGTLPRRKKKDLTEVAAPASVRNGSREPSLNRAATLRRQTSRDKDSPVGRSLPPYPRGRRPAAAATAQSRTLILHEAAVQTLLTAQDLEGRTPLRGSGHTTHAAAQTEKSGADNSEGLLKVSKEYAAALERLSRLLGQNPAKELTSALLDDVERHVADLSWTLIKQREEIFNLTTLNVSCQKELEESRTTLDETLEHQKLLLAEHAELQDFLQTEKTMLSDSLQDANEEISRLKEELSSKETELNEQQDQCKHLVRLAEQRRQENLSVEARLSGLEQRSHDVMRQQGAAVSGAAVALTSLGARLDTLVDQLAGSYNVAEKDLEEVIFHNEVYSPEGSPDIREDSPLTRKEPLNGCRKPIKKTASFLNAVLGAIRSATQSPSLSARSRKPSSTPLTPPDQNSDSLGLLDSEITFEPLSKSSESGDDGQAAVADLGAASLHSLSAAILQRQRTEEEEEEACRSLDLGLSPDLNSLVDQVIQVDNLVTKLLKVLRIVQMDSDACMDQIADQRAELDDRLRVESEIRGDAEKRLQRVELELEDARCLLAARIQQLEDAKLLLTETWQRESQRQYATIDHALETLQSMQDVVDQFPPLAKLQQRLEDCNFRTAAGDDLNANSTNQQQDDNGLTNGSSMRPTAV